MLMPTLETARLTIRPFQADDLAAALSLFGDDPAHIDRRRRWLLWAELNHEQLALLLQPPYGDRAVVLTSTGTLIGAAALVPSFMPFGLLPGWNPPTDPTHWQMTPEVGLFYHIATSHRQQGIATEAARALIDFAFTHLRLARIVATTEHDNHASQAVMRKLGMTLLANPYPDPPWMQVVGVLHANHAPL